MSTNSTTSSMEYDESSETGGTWAPAPAGGLRVEQLLPPDRPGKSWLCRLEDGSRLRITQGEVADFALYAGRGLSPSETEALRAAAGRSLLREKAMTLLTGRPHSAGELVDKLKARGGSEEEAWEVAQWAEDLGLLNDKEYAKSVARHYSAKGYGIYKIKNELFRRKVPRACWEDALNEMAPPDEAVDRYLDKHLHSDDPKEVKRASDALARRGFSWREISRGLSRRRLLEE